MGRTLVSRLNVAMVALAALVVIFMGTTSTALAADPRDFTLINATGATIRYVYVSPTYESDWGSDVLGDDVLPAGHRLTITFSRFRAGNCFYDVKVVTDRGGEGVMKNVNLCTTNTITFH